MRGSRSGCRAELGQNDVAGRARKKIVKPSRRRPLVSYPANQDLALRGQVEVTVRV